MSAGEDERRWLEGLDERTEYEREYEHRMSAGDRDTLAALLAEHRHILPLQVGFSRWEPNGCGCGEPIDNPAMAGDYDEAERIHRAHVADVLLASDWLREQRAEAWKAGHGWCDDGIDGMCDHEPFTPSPYLED